MLIIFIRSIILYGVIILAIRLMGKRQIGQLQPSELVITILVSNIATMPIEDASVPMIVGIAPILILVCLDVIMSGATLKSRRLRRIVSGSPQIIIRDGVVDQKQMKVLRYTLDDLLESLRSYSIFDIKEVQFAIVETTGQISVYQKNKYQNVVNEDFKIIKQDQDPPYLVIDDGCFVKESIIKLNLDIEWINKIVKEKGLTVSDVFMLTVSPDKTYDIIEKDKAERLD